MQQFVIEGGYPLSGEVTPSGSKNAALKMLAACLLTDAPVTLDNMPDILDVRTLIQIMTELGVAIEWTAPDQLRVHACEITSTQVDPQLAGKLRSSIVLAGPLLARCGRVDLPVPGGDAIGERRLDMHAFALRQLGAQITFDGGVFKMRAERLNGADILLAEASVTATENAIMAAVLA
ncbi:MAG: UDP-N-acetylglucosamine 1-carboxyvinyltransferase, partial [Chloroflexi bacterium]|nr:UDP-N-acetylglucosamine 1-carboxyvinyltransferase [Chloroflexota bacterium]